MSEEPYMHWEDVLRFLADRDAQIDRLKAENGALRELTCLKCGRALPPDGDCYGCSYDRVQAERDKAVAEAATLLWVLREVATALASTTLAEEHLARDRNREAALRRIIKNRIEDGGPCSGPDDCDCSECIARRALGEETK